MDLDMVLNELSYPVPEGNLENAKAMVSNLVRTLGSATTLGVNLVLRSRDRLSRVQPITNVAYTVGTWMRQDADREQKLFLKRLQDKVPSSAAIQDEEARNLLASNEFLYLTEQARGLGVAQVLDSLAISFIGLRRFDSAILEITIRNPSTQENSSEAVNHAARTDHLDQHRDWISKRAIRDGREIWARRQELFPNLLFCDSVDRGLRDVRRGHAVAGHIIRRLHELNQAAEAWTEGPFEHRSLPCRASPESNSTMSNPVLRQQREFICPDGRSRIFDWHLKLAPHAWRIHYIAEPNVMSVTVGYIGAHLPTATM